MSVDTIHAKKKQKKQSKGEIKSLYKIQASDRL